MAALLSEQQWSEYERLGYLTLPSILAEPELAQLQRRMDEIMLGQVSYPELQFQLDTGGPYEDLPDPVPQNSAPTLAYRKVQGLEADPMVLDLIRRPVFRDICDRHYGRHSSISIFRAMLMNKPAGRGTYLPWHQDAGDVWRLDRDPLVTIWIALDPATRMNGCVQVIPGSHRLGLLSHHGSTLSPDDAQRHCPESAITYLEIEAGDGLLLHNWLLHRSAVNHTGSPRRALTSCYMDGRTRNTLTGDQFPIVFGEPGAAWPFLQSVREENRSLRESAAEAERYARSLAEHAGRLEQMRSEAEQYAKALEVELSGVRAAAARPGTLNLDCPD
ncbi:MAG: phytanoyl-CoA dioxygenase family protein [Acidobacteriota bacterium]